MSFGVRLVGHWRRLTYKGLKDLGPKEWSKIDGMLYQMGLATEYEIKSRIKYREYRINHPFTVANKTSGQLVRANGKTSKVLSSRTKDQPLVDTGQLLKSIRVTKVGSRGMPAVFVGVLKTARNSQGKSLYQIAKIVHYGKIIVVTPKMRVWLAAHGLPLKPETRVLRIPARRFISSVVLDPVFTEKLRIFTGSKMTQILMER